VEGSDLCLPQWETGVMIRMYVCASNERSLSENFWICIDEDEKEEFHDPAVSALV
jgi:hypothetical protein